jgi:hypothetical protein
MMTAVLQPRYAAKVHACDKVPPREQLEQRVRRQIKSMVGVTTKVGSQGKAVRVRDLRPKAA